MPKDGPPPKKRGPYKRYLEPGSNVPVPKSTVRTRDKQARLEAEAFDASESGHSQGETSVNDAESPNDEVADLGTQDSNESVTNDDEEDKDGDRDDRDDRNRDEDLEEDEDEEYFDVDQEDEDQVLDQHENLINKPKLDYVKKYNLNAPLHNITAITRLDALLMILHLAVRHCHTQHFVEHQIKFVNTLFGENVLDISYHIFKNLFPPASSITRHYFCPDCEVSLGSPLELKGLKVKPCSKCKKIIKVNSVDSGNYFVALSVSEQLERLLNKQDIQLVQNRSHGPDLCDISDGEIFKNCQHMGLDLENALSVTFNTDGVAVHESTKNSMWPIFLYVNEIVPEQRFKVENLILAGLWFGESSPNMAHFLKPCLLELVDLSHNGVAVSKPDGSVTVHPVYPVACSLDSVAKPKVVCQKQFNGRKACLYCMHPNDTKVDPSSNLCYYDTSTAYDLRTEDEVVTDMFEADRLDKEGSLRDGSVNGFLGISVLLLLPKIRENSPCNPFSIVWGVVIDYIHCALEGLTDDLLGLFEALLSPDQLRTLNYRITTIRPPQAMTRKPRSLH